MARIFVMSDNLAVRIEIDDDGDRERFNLDDTLEVGRHDEGRRCRKAVA